MFSVRSVLLTLNLCSYPQIGSFFMLNLCLVVIATQFSETKQREHQLMQEQRAACLSSSTWPNPATATRRSSSSSATSSVRRANAPLLSSGRSATNHWSRRMRKQTSMEERRASNNMVRRRGRGLDGSMNGWMDVALSSSLTALQMEPHLLPQQPIRRQRRRQPRRRSCKRVEGACRRRSRELWIKMRVKLWGIVESKYFNRGIMVAILINTISMGIEHHEQVKRAHTHIHTHHTHLIHAVFFYRRNGIS